MKCIFCSIVHGEFDTEFLYEDDKVVVFRDIHPKAPTHLLIVTKEHIEKLSDLNEENISLVSHMVKVANDLARDLNLKGYKLLINVGKEGGQEIFHLHVHLLSQSS